MLTSLKNPLVKQIRQLQRAKERREQQLFLLEGTHLLQEAVAVAYPLATVCCTTLWQERHEELWERISQQAQRIEFVSPEVLRAMATTVEPDGIVATAKRRLVPSQQPLVNSLGVVLETIQDPGNLGGIIRSAAAAGVDGLWLSEDCVDPDHPKVLRASAGQWFRLPLAVSPNLQTTLLESQKQGLQIVATSPLAELTYWQADLSRPSLIVMGNEGAGLSPELMALADVQVKIPLSPGVESLNVTIATALVLYEAQRQRHFNPAKG